MKRLPRLLFASQAVLSLSVGIASGMVGTASAATRTCEASTPIDDRPDLRRGDKGSCVTVAQGLLINVGTFHGTITTNFGPATEKAVRQAQRNARIPETGVINQETWDAIARNSPATPDSATRNCDNRHYRTICVIKGNNGSAGTLYAIENGRVKWTFVVRTSDSRNPNADPYKRTSEGMLKVTRKVTGNPATYQLYYDDYNDNGKASDGKQAIRYSQIFRDCGYDGNLYNGKCVNDFRGATFGGVDLRSREDAKKLFEWSNKGTEIVILHSPDATL